MTNLTNKMIAERLGLTPDNWQQTNFNPETTAPAWPDFLNDIAAAEIPLQYMLDQNMRVQIDRAKAGTIVKVAKLKTEVDDWPSPLLGWRQIDGKADTTPLAICKAFMEATQ